MKKPISSLLLLITAILSLGQEVANGMPAMANPTCRIVSVSQSGSILLEIRNPSDRSMRLWEETNSWGAARWRLLRIRGGQVETFFQNPNRIFTGNLPQFHELAPGAHLEMKLDPNGGNWCGFGYCAAYNEKGLGGMNVNFERDDTIIAIYDVPPTNEGKEMGVWHGVIAALTVSR